MRVLIDLDATPAPSRPRPKLGLRMERRLVTPVALATLLLLVVGGAASPAPARVITEVAGTGGVSATSHLLTPAALYVSHIADFAPETPEDARSVVEAWPLVPGGPRWSTTVRATDPDLTLDEAGTTLVVRPGKTGTLTLIDVATGRVRWRTDDYAVADLAGSRIVYGDLGTIRMVDVATGRVRWEHEDQPMAVDVDPKRRVVLVIDQEGLPSIRSLADGRMLVKPRSVGIDPFEWEQGGQSETIIGDTLYLHTDMFLAAYRLRDLHRLWSVRIAEPDMLGMCGALLCAAGGRGVTAIDPATGGIRWTGPRWRSITADGQVVGIDLTAARLDLATGRVLAEFGRGATVGDLLLRNDRDHTWVTGLAGGEIIGELPLIVSTRACSAAGAYLACPTNGQTVTVWKVR
ncbi:outer membrane protein assembly factor BamB family protein [Paractinoplanes durhamensis]|uniref:outer membrane protein assembly factor BamB family protein n=1 Tax=Paractinoplanes durhamensis TaxID=113563 RepID=UPI00194223CD|nr:PQQ-binding-like beta-propeller repeat protein [Actinoplanes durhamensis]